LFLLKLAIQERLRSYSLWYKYNLSSKQRLVFDHVIIFCAVTLTAIVFSAFGKTIYLAILAIPFLAMVFLVNSAIRYNPKLSSYIGINGIGPIYFLATFAYTGFIYKIVQSLV